MTEDPTRPAARGSAVLTIGYGTTVAMWAISYISFMQPGQVVGELVVGVLVLCLVAGGVVAGRAGCSLAAGAGVGLVSALLNMLMIGSLVGGEQPGEIDPTGVWWVLGTLGVSIAATTAGAALGRLAGPPATRRRDWLSPFVRLAAGAVFLLLVTGGLVTGFQAGFAVPDWPGSFGHNMLLFPLTEMTGGTFYEHAHRLYGMLVGVTAIILAVSLFVWDRRAWVRGLGVLVLALVVVQGVIGGVWVEAKALPLVLFHGVNGQVILAMVVVLAAATSAAWRADRLPTAHPAVATDRTLVIVAVAALIGQIALGAAYRHLQGVPDASAGLLMGTRHGHAFVGSLLAGGLALAAALRGWGIYVDQPIVVRSGKAMLHALIAQILLGLGAFVVVPSEPRPADETPVIEVVVTTMHQATGAVLLATAALLLAWSRRLLRPA